MKDPDVLMQVIALIIATASIMWLAVGIPLKIAPKASLRFGFANLLLLLSIVLTLQRGTEASYIKWPFADLLAIAAFLLVHAGLRELFKQNSRRHLQLFIFIACAAVQFSLTPDYTSTLAFGITFSSAAGLCFALIFVDVVAAAKREFSWLAAIVIAWPFAFAGLLMLWRIRLFIIAPPERIEPTVDAQTLWPFVVLSLLLNISLFSCVLARLIAKIRNYSERDHLTGLLNRRAFETRLNHEHERSLRSENLYGIVIFDLDHFKKINDQHGHAAGDAALKHTADVLRKTLRNIDSAARYGGEEFIVLLPNTNNDQTVLVAERLRLALSQEKLAFHGQDIAITASFGGVVSAQKPNEMLLKLADKALYHAKNQGRNCVVMAN